MGGPRLPPPPDSALPLGALSALPAGAVSMARAFVLLLLLLAGTLVRARDDLGFDLADALDDIKKTTEAPKKPPSGGDLDLSEALDGAGDANPVAPRQPEPKPNPKPNQPGSSGGFSDSDLADAAGGDGGRDGHGGSKPRHDGAAPEAEQPQGVIPGIVGAVVVAVAGAVSSFIAYQKKKLCFKENQQGEVNLENGPPSRTEPPVQQTLLEK
ncbi:CD99 antigen isoform X2 [Cavia porcellus]|uniref:CD99 antigen isoform X2 n=1 Tax=Cavia porcellus TaxID=10141 RepID=UPI002FDF3CF2